MNQMSKVTDKTLTQCMEITQKFSGSNFTLLGHIAPTSFNFEPLSN